ncbi:FAD-binding protein, partial [Pelagibacteraceae bacterium]|nr:FAD-binding protein [Pelagibacteraceae bacterium]
MKNASLQKELENLLGVKCSFSESVRTNYSRGEDIYDPVLPQCVVFPESNKEISEIVKICDKYKTPIVPFGTATSLEGNVLGNSDGISLSLEKMDNILEINESDFDCRVQAFVTREKLNESLKDKGVFFPIDPGANASLGGMTATSASGTMAVKYGTMKTVVTGLTVVLASGKIIQTGTRTKKSSAGYNLTNLFVGSEGTLGIITEICLRLSPIPESIMSAVCQFPDLESAVLTSQEIIQYGVPIARIEMLNKDQMDISIKYSDLKNLEIKPTLFFEFHGSEVSNKEHIGLVEQISENNGGSKFKWARTTEDRNKLWKARHEVYYSVKAQKNNIRVYTTDICVPISNLVECIKFAENEIQKYGLKAPMVGHVGDGNFHTTIMYDPNKKDDYEIIRKFSNKLVDKCLSLDGTITGEHGVGMHKKEYLIKQH